MNQPIEAFCRPGLVHFMAFPELAGGEGPWEETVRRIALDPFFTAIEITHMEDPGVRERVRDLIRLARLSVGYGAHPDILRRKLNVNALNESERGAACAELRKHLDEAVFMGAETFVILSGKDPGAADREKAMEALVKSLDELCAYSSSLGGPKVVLELFDCEVDKCCLMGPTSLAVAVAEKVGVHRKNFGLLVDLSHIPLLKESPQQALVPIKEYLAGAHLGNAVIQADCAGYGDYHPIFGSPGSANDLPEMMEFLKTLREIGFLNEAKRPIVSFEIKPQPGQDPLIIIANAQRVLREAWARL
jgi:sugar phosphate isomerase/epimerase